MDSASRDPSIENEPHLTGAYDLDPTEAAAEDKIAREQGLESHARKVEHSVWDEPGLSTPLVGAPSDNLTYANWLQAGIADTTPQQSWMTTLWLVLSAGLFGVVGTFMVSGETGNLAAIVTVAVLGPLTEEVMKIALATWVIEKRPFWFRSPIQILTCGFAGGLAFAAVENVLYLNVYVPDPQAWLILWRWTICVALHAGCSTIAAMGLVRVWTQVMTKKTQPRLADGGTWIVAAVVIHGCYNFLAAMIELLGV